MERYIRDAKILIATQEPNEISSALSLVEAALAISPCFELALELKARSLLYLRCFKDVAYMLQDYIPSLRMPCDDTSSTSSSGSFDSSKEQIRLISYGDEPNFKCFSVSNLKKKIMASLYKNCKKEGQWRYLVLGQACCHLGLMEDAMVLLQTGKRLATESFRPNFQSQAKLAAQLCYHPSQKQSLNFSVISSYSYDEKQLQLQLMMLVFTQKLSGILQKLWMVVVVPLRGLWQDATCIELQHIVPLVELQRQ